MLSLFDGYKDSVKDSTNNVRSGKMSQVVKINAKTPACLIARNS